MNAVRLLAESQEKLSHRRFRNIFSFFSFLFHRHHCRRRGTGGAVPAQGGHGAKARGRGEGHDLGKHENGNAELRPEAKALTLLSWQGTATSLTGLRHQPHGWPG